MDKKKKTLKTKQKTVSGNIKKSMKRINNLWLNFAICKNVASFWGQTENSVFQKAAYICLNWFFLSNNALVNKHSWYDKNSIIEQLFLVNMDRIY